MSEQFKQLGNLSKEELCHVEDILESFKCKVLNDLTSYRPNVFKKRAFTLAEVLITLGIIGVVAALTMPTLIHNHQKKVLKTQFKKAVSIGSQVVQKTRMDMGIDKLGAYCATLTPDKNDYVYSKECYNALYKNLLSFKSKNVALWAGDAQSNLDRFQRDDLAIKSYIGTQVSRSDLLGAGYAIYFTNIMPDGTFMNFWIIGYALLFCIDINGGKGPNKLGHDIFLFQVSQKNDSITYMVKPKNYTEEELENLNNSYPGVAGFPCSINSKQKGNGIGCAYYALRDECPDDPTKGYWECLPR